MLNRELIYTAEDVGGEIFMICGWPGLDQEGFKKLVLERLENEGIPEPDMNIQQLELCEWPEVSLGSWTNWKGANFATLYWTYPGVWSEKLVTTMPGELAAEFWDGEGVDRTDPKHPEFHDLMAGVYDNREKS